MGVHGKRRAAWLWWPMVFTGVLAVVLSMPLSSTLNGLGILGLATSIAGIGLMSWETQ